MDKQKLANGFRLSDLIKQINTKKVDIQEALGDTPCLVFRPLSDNVSPLFYSTEFHGSSSDVFKFSETGTLNPQKKQSRAHGYLDPAAIVVPLWKSDRNAFRSMIMLGRAGNSDIRINSNQVSKNHAFLSKDSDGGWQIIDNYSTNGTYVNGVALESAIPHNLAPSSEIKLGVVYAVFLDTAGIKQLCDLYGELDKGSTQRIRRKPVCPSCGTNPVKDPKPSCKDVDGCAKVHHKSFITQRLTLQKP